LLKRSEGGSGAFAFFTRRGRKTGQKYQLGIAFLAGGSVRSERKRGSQGTAT